MSEDRPPYEPDGPLPYEPPGLRKIIQSISYKPDWRFYMRTFSEDGEIRGWQLSIFSNTENSLNHSQRINVHHSFLIPPASYNRDSWVAWIFDRIRDVETHEACEFFQVGGYREFAPHHSNGEDPYRVWHVSDHATARKQSGDE